MKSSPFSDSSDKFEIVDSAISHLLRHLETKEDVKQILDDFGLLKKDLVIIPLNNAE